MTARVIVVGAEPVGLCVALGLARNDIDVTLVDLELDDSTRFQYVHDWSVLPGLDSLGVLDDARAAGTVETDIAIAVARTGERIDLDLTVLRDDTPFPFNLHLGQGALSAILAEHLTRLPNAEIVRASHVDSLTQDNTGVSVGIVTADGARVIRGEWLIGADGTVSAVRRLLGLGFPGFTWRERSVTALIDATLPPSTAATTFVVDEEHSALLQKAGDDRWTYTYAEPLTLNESTVAERLSESVTRLIKSSDVTILDWRSERMHHRSAPTYRTGRVLLAGESAHVTNRMIGHSSITGFFDAYRLTEALSAVIGGSADKNVLDSYAERRRRVFLDDVAPLSTSRKHLLTLDLGQLEPELDGYRKASGSPAALRDLLLVNRELAGTSPVIPLG